MPKGKPTQYYTSEETRQALVAIGVQHGAKPERAASLGLRISALHHGRLVEMTKQLISELEKNTCLHEETYRGGVIWEICHSCGSKWADDEGGKPDAVEPRALIEARLLLREIEEAR